MTVPSPVPRFDALVLAGGSARRLGGVDKPALEVGGRRLLDRVLDAAAAARLVVVVGPERPGLAGRVRRVREQPVGGGPVAALAAALPLVDSDLIAVLGADLPFLTAAELQELCELADGQDAAMLVDDRGRPQYLAAVWQATSLRSAVAAVGEPVGQPLSGVYAGRSVARLATPGSAAPPAWWDCDTVGDLETARNWL